MTATAGYVRGVKALVERPPRSIAVDGEIIRVRVRESAQARTSRVIVGPRRPLEVIVPAGIDDATVDELLESKRRWIEGKLRAAREIAGRPYGLGLRRPLVVWLDGQAVPVKVEAGRRSVASVRDGILFARGPDPQAAVHRWYRREARRRIEAVAEVEAARLGLQYESIGIRDPKTRWGSCSRRRHLSFSWRLVLAPPEVLGYVVVHELCHLREPSHSKAFWRILETARPGWQGQARWLRENGQELHAYEPEVAP